MEYSPNGKAILLRIDDTCATPYYRVDSIENNKTTINAFWCGTDEEVEVQYKLYDNGVVVTDTVGLGSYEVGDNIDSLVAFFVWNEPFVIDIKANWHSQIQLYLRYADRLNDRPLFDKPIRIRGNSLKLPNGVKLTRKEK